MEDLARENGKGHLVYLVQSATTMTQSRQEVENKQLGYEEISGLVILIVIIKVYIFSIRKFVFSFSFFS